MSNQGGALPYWQCPECFSIVAFNLDSLIQHPFMSVAKMLQDIMQVDLPVDIDLFPTNILEVAEAAVEEHELVHGIKE